MTWLSSVSELELSSYAVVRGLVCVMHAFEATAAECVLLNVSENEPWLSDAWSVCLARSSLVAVCLALSPCLSYKPG